MLRVAPCVAPASFQLEKCRNSFFPPVLIFKLPETSQDKFLLRNMSGDCCTQTQQKAPIGCLPDPAEDKGCLGLSPSEEIGRGSQFKVQMLSLAEEGGWLQITLPGTHISSPSSSHRASI